MLSTIKPPRLRSGPLRDKFRSGYDARGGRSLNRPGQGLEAGVFIAMFAGPWCDQDLSLGERQCAELRIGSSMKEDR